MTIAPDALATNERAELERQGAKAATRGDGAASNPMDDGRNLPSTTGEQPADWSLRRDAWLDGFHARPGFEQRARAGTPQAAPLAASAAPDGTAPAAFELRYDSLNGAAALVFPCNAGGRVEIDKLDERARANYLLARALVGRDYDLPSVSSRR